MSAEPITNAVAKREEPTPRAMVLRAREDFTAVLPSHIKPDTWVRLATGALKKGKKIRLPGGQVCTELEAAALNNPQVFMASLLESARLGLEPGTEQYYLTPRKVKGSLEILGIVGYQGYIELMYRAGAISSVIAEVVLSNDVFVWRPGALDTQRPPRWEGPQRQPYHEIDWDSEDRGELRLVYAYAIMKDGAISRVCVLNKAAIKRIKESSQGSNGEYSPWVKHTEAMWLKSAVRQLAKWVPTSAEYVREQLRAQAEIAREERPQIPAAPGAVQQLDADQIESDGTAGSPIVEAEIVDEITDAQSKKLHALLREVKVGEQDRHSTLGLIVGRDIGSASELSKDDATMVIDLLERCTQHAEPDRALDAMLAEIAGARA